jgi:P4 family phage/plasmid primase-like protien
MKARQWFEAGYTDLVSVVPPGAALSPGSRINPDARGKAPGRRYQSGQWGGYPWMDSTPTAAFADEIDATGASVGLRADHFPAIDVDVTHAGLVRLISDVIERVLPTGPVRVGRAPKRLYPFRLAPGAEPFPRLQLHFEHEDARHIVEILGAGQQYVVDGIHPRTNAPYYWDRVIRADALPTITAEQAERVLDAIASDVLDLVGIDYERIGHRGVAHRRDVNQDTLLADSLDVLAEAVRRIPNTVAVFPTREDYIRLGYALRGACQKDPARGFAIFEEWALRYPGKNGVRNTPESVRLDWERMHPPFELGANYALDMAKQFGYDVAAVEFPAEPAPLTAPPPEDDFPKPGARNSDMWLEDKLVERFGGKIRRVPDLAKWLAFDGHVWREDLQYAVPQLARKLCVQTANHVIDMAEGDKAKRAAEAQARAICSRRQLDAMLGLAEHDSRLVIRTDELDTDPDLLGTPVGVLNLRTAELLPADPSRFVTRQTAVAMRPDPCPRWAAFLKDLTGGDGELEAYLQRLAGYALTGHTIEHTLVFIWGPGGNGKSTFLDVLEALLGGYATTASMSVFTSSKYERHPTELAGLAFARLVIAQELKEGDTWDEQRIKALTGGDRVKARFMRQDEFTFLPKFKLLFAGNGKPRLATMDEALRRRLHMVPCTHQPAKKDPKLKGHLLSAELPGILAWAVQGAQAWYKQGLCPPAAVLAETEDYLSEHDPVTRWLAERCVVAAGVSAPVADLYDSWAGWCGDSGEVCGSVKAFSVKLSNRGYRRGRTGASRLFVGLEVKR